MNICKPHAVWALLLWVVAQHLSHGQADFNIKAGMESWLLKDEKEQTGQSCHPGQMIGLDVLIKKEKALFVPGIHYHRISIENEDHCFDFNFSDPHHLHYFTIPLTGGYEVLDEPDVNIALLGGVEINFFYDLDDNDVGLEDDMLYGVYTSLVGRLYAELFSVVTAEINYHYALQPIIKIRDDSRLRGWTIAIGAKF